MYIDGTAIALDAHYAGSIIQVSEDGSSWSDLGRAVGPTDGRGGEDVALISFEGRVPTGRTYYVRVFNRPELGTIGL